MKIGKIELLKAQGFKLAEKDGKKFIYANLEDTRLFRSEESGRVYMDLVMFETPGSEFSDYAVSESKKLDEEIELPIIGNFKNWKKKEDDLQKPEDYKNQPEAEGDLPF